MKNNTTVGLWNYDITNINVGDYASITITSDNWHQTKIENFGIEIYYIDSSSVSEYLKPKSETKKVTAYAGISNNAGNGSVNYIKQTFGLNDNNKVGYIEHNYTDNNNKYVTLDITSAINAAKQNNKNDITFLAMCSRNNDGNTSNKWSDVWIEFGKINYAGSLALAEIQPLKKAMTEFENKMASGKIYKNMGNAYTAYVNAQKAIDAYSYGGVTSLSIAQYTSTLSNAVNSMTEWSAPAPNISPKFSSSDNGTIPLNTGCLWYEYTNDPLVTSFTAEGNNVTANFYYQNGVYLYTDSSPNIPYLVGFYKTSSSITANPSNPRVLYMAMRGQNGGLFIKNSQYRGDVVSREFSNVISKAYQINAYEIGDDNNIILSTGDMRYMANYFNISYQAAFQGGNYFVAAKPTQFSIGNGTKSDGNTVKWVKYISGFDTRTFLCYKLQAFT